MFSFFPLLKYCRGLWDGMSVVVYRCHLVIKGCYLTLHQVAVDPLIPRWWLSPCREKRSTFTAQQTRDVDPLLAWCWHSVADGGPISSKRWFNVSYLLVDLLNSTCGSLTTLALQQSRQRKSNVKITLVRRLVFDEKTSTALTPFTPTTQQRRYIDSVLAQCWSNVADGGPTLSRPSIKILWELD